MIRPAVPDAHVVTWPLPVMLAVIGVALACPAAVQGQMVPNFGALDPARPNIVHLATGLENGFVGGVGYTRAYGIGRRTLLLSGSVTVPWANADLRDHDVRIGASVDVLRGDRVRMVAGLGGGTRATTNLANRMRSVGADGVLLGGYWTARWFVAGEGGYDGAIATYVEHSDYYRETVYADARDGWYGDTGANIRLGMAGGLSLGRSDLVLRAGTARDREGRSQLLPAYAGLGLNVRF
jgi:hypothetical protein